MSEESDIEDRVASEQDDDSDGPDSTEYDSDIDKSVDSNAFVIMEAVESDGDDESDYGSVENTEQEFFPQFARLPKELRAAIWEFFDPYLKSKNRIYETELYMESGPVQSEMRLIQQTVQARVMLSTHRESRELALKFYPDIIQLYEYTGMRPRRYRDFRIRYETDIVLLSFHGMDNFTATLDNLLQTSLVGVKNLAFSCFNMGPDWLFPPDQPPQHVQQLKAMYYHCDLKTGALGTDTFEDNNLIRTFLARGWERDGIQSTVRYYGALYCWPDLEKQQGFAEKRLEPVIDHETFKVWPMLDYPSKNGEIYYYIDYDSNESDSESETEDEYESEGIDDATINSEDTLSGDEDDLVVQSDSEEEDASAFNGFSPIQDEDPELHLGDEAGVGNFSSLEPESPNRDGNNSDHAVSDEEPVRTTGRAKRRIVLSDDEDEPEIEDNTEVRMPSRPTKRSRIVLSDSEDDSGDEAGAMERTADHTKDKSSSEEEESEASEEEPADEKPMSLFEKLGRFREENPIPPESDVGSEGDESMSGEDYYGGRENDFQDDEAEDDDLLDDGGGEDMLEGEFEDEEDGW
ncbi:hypothetical protein F5Y04DRAFT_252753 [Hypomontagnella monticulosa]|nr:hypothetical protein F5Y04DRAFT_252753 [Hypomontagnella monticulosa]